MLAAQAEGGEVETIEGLAKGISCIRWTRPAATAILFQCGFCTPGFVMSALELPRDDPGSSEEDGRMAVSGNLCRCTGI